MIDIFEIAGRSILIAGAAGGIGSGIAAELARRGANLTIADIDLESVERVRDSLSGDHHASCHLDVTDEASCAVAVERAIGNGGRLDGMLNAAGILRLGSAIELRRDRFQGKHGCQCHRFTFARPPGR